MATSIDYIEFLMDQLSEINFEFRYKKMFGEYCVYANDKPIILVCDNNTYIKTLPCIETLMQGAKLAAPYSGAKPQYVLDIDDTTLLRGVIELLEQNTPLPKPRKKRIKD